MKCAKRKFVTGTLVLLTMLASAALGATPLNVRVNSNTANLQNEQQLWISPLDANNVMVVYRDFQLGYRRVSRGVSTDGGTTWTTSLFEPYPFLVQSDPCLVASRQGIFYATMMNLDHQEPYEKAIVVTRSTQDGDLWTTPTPVCDWPGVGLDDKEFTAIDRTGGIYDGNFYCTWARFPGLWNPRIMFVRSVDGCMTFDDTLQIGPSPNIEGCGGQWGAGMAPIPIVDAEGAVHVLWLGPVIDTIECSFDWAIYHTLSTDGGESFSEREPKIFTNLGWESVDGDVAVYGFPAGDCDISDGPYSNTLYIALTRFFCDDLPETDVTVTKSTDGGLSWSVPAVVNDDLPGLNYDQFHPWLVVNEDGVVLLIFYDQRYDSSHRKFDAVFSASFDGGETYTTNMRISDTSSDPLDAMSVPGYRFEVADNYSSGRYGSSIQDFPFRAGLLGEYIAIHAKHDTISTAWTDTREGSQDTYYARFLMPFQKPRLYYPEDSGFVYTDYPSFRWSTCWHESEDSYRLEISTDPAFTSVDFLYGDLSTNDFIMPSPIDSSDYYWRVKAFRAEGDSTEYSDVFRFAPGFCVDTDGDGYGDPDVSYNTCPDDNCAFLHNPDQEDSDGDMVGDTCDNCLLTYNHYQEDSDGDLVGDSCDNCIYDYNPSQSDTDGNNIGDACDYICGDSDGSESIDIDDVVFLISYIFSSGASPDPVASGDADGSGAVDIDDVVYLIAYIFAGGSAPCEPA